MLKRKDSDCIKFLIGGFPCTKFSISQKKDREVLNFPIDYFLEWKCAQGEYWYKYIDDFEKQLSKNTGKEFKFGLGIQLFFNCVVAKEKLNPDVYIFENVNSMDKGIKEFIQRILECDITETNAALVSAQTRKRIIFHNLGTVPVPEDRYIYIKDIVESSIDNNEKLYQLKHLSNAVCFAQRGRYVGKNKKIVQQFEVNKLGKTNALTTVQKDNMILEPIRIGDIGTTSEAHRVYSAEGKSITLKANGGGQGAKTGLYLMPIKVGEINKGSQGDRIYSINGKAISLSSSSGGTGSNTGLYAIPIKETNDVRIPVHYVKDKVINYKGVPYSINLDDGFYIIRKLTPNESEALQTLPKDYTYGVSTTQRYKMIGNGWCKEDIKRFFAKALEVVNVSEKIVCHSMYDGISTGRLIFDDLGYNNIDYYSYEIDKYANAISEKNYPDIERMGDAFVVRTEDWVV